MTDTPAAPAKDERATANQAQEAQEAIDFLRMGIEFAYEQGLHEIGFNPVGRIAARPGYSTSAFKSPHYYVFLVLSVGVSVPLILTGIFSLPGPQPQAPQGAPL